MTSLSKSVRCTSVILSSTFQQHQVGRGDGGCCRPPSSPSVAAPSPANPPQASFSTLPAWTFFPLLWEVRLPRALGRGVPPPRGFCQPTPGSSAPSPRLPATAAKSLQSCPTLCNPIDGSLPSSPVTGILQARTLQWVAISFSNA